MVVRAQVAQVIQTVEVIPFTQRVNWVTATKRVMDVLFSFLFLILAAPLFLLIPILIRLGSRGPVFFSQRRAGRLLGLCGGQPRFSHFMMFKFRTMRPDAERETGPVLAADNDPRITPIGRFLRRTRLDELPQLVNVLRGDMSLVGPRPERPELMGSLTDEIPFFEERMRVKPGITGLAQINLTYGGDRKGSTASDVYDILRSARDESVEAIELKLVFDLAYLASQERFWSFLRTDLYIMLKTPLVMLAGFGR